MTAVLIARLAQIPAGEGRTFSIGDRRIAVFRAYNNEVFATQAECPHLNGPLADGLTGGGIVVCPLHERAYDLRTGAGLNGECTHLSVFPVSVRDGDQIWLDSTDPRTPAAAGARAS
jgi:nitrite reductase (NADH) small subunit